VQLDGDLVFLADREPAEGHMGRPDFEPWRRQRLRGEAGQQPVQGALAVGEAGRLLGGGGQVHAAQRGEEVLQVAPLQQVGRLGPAPLTGEGELVEVAAHLAGGEDKRPGERLPGHVERAGGGTGQGNPVAVAVASIAGVGG
jgi:hypothetical protein